MGEMRPRYIWEDLKEYGSWMRAGFIRIRKASNGGILEARY
jgi:hypothetical protein